MLLIGCALTILGLCGLLMSFGNSLNIIIFIISLFSLIFGIVLIVAWKKKEKLRISNNEKTELQQQMEDLKQKELELKILKENNLIKNNHDNFCKYCGAKLSSEETQCSHCGSVVNK